MCVSMIAGKLQQSEENVFLLCFLKLGDILRYLLKFQPLNRAVKVLLSFSVVGVLRCVVFFSPPLFYQVKRAPAPID